MKNIPEKIYLQLGCEDAEDFKELSEVSWCTDKIFDTDLVYYSHEALNEIMSQIEKESSEHYTTNGLIFHGISLAEIERIFRKFGYEPKAPF